jgi:3-oxoacyl-[acyl-carrier-protein] synthase-1
MANILHTHFISALGDKEQTLDAIKKKHFHMDRKSVRAIEGEVSVPYYTFKEEVQDTLNGIYSVMKKIVHQSIKGLTSEQKAQTAIIVGSSIIDWNVIDAIESSNYAYKRKAFSSLKRSMDSYAKDLSDEFGLNGFTLTINTACTSSANAILEASNLIDSGLYPYVVVVGLEVFSVNMSSGFYAMQLLSSSSIKPFDTQRDGTILGEGVVALLLGNEQTPWRVLGGFSNCNGVNITSVSEEGDEFVEVMEKALMMTQIDKENITALKTHATGTLSNDISEMNAIRKIFTKDIVFTALKPYIGHTVGACGALEIAIFMGCVDDGFIPQTLNHENAISSEYRPLLEHLACNKGTFMFNYFGFGANNTSLILQKESL